MNYYIELTLIENKKYTLYELWSKVYMQIHLAFAAHKQADDTIPYGVSFPEYRFNEKAEIGFIGGKLRVFASSKAELEVLDLPKWFDRLADYVHIMSIKEIPKNIQQYAIYKRKHVKGESRVQKDIEQYATYYAKQHNVNYEDALAIYSHMKVREINLPFIQMISLTNEHCFKLFIERQVVERPSQLQKFTSYGLSSESTVPEF